MRDAIKMGIVNPLPNSLQKLIDGKANMYKGLMTTVSKQWENTLEKNPWLGMQSSWQLPTTRRYLQRRNPPITPSVQPNAALDWLVELARFPVAFGSIGIVKSFEQYVTDGETTYTSQEFWGAPYPSFSIRWFFRLSALSTLGSPWINSTGTSAIPDYLPGDSYDDFSESNGIWFPAGSPSSANIHLPVPGGRVVRLLAIVSGTQTALTIGAKLAGTTQTELSADAQTVVRTTW